MPESNTSTDIVKSVTNLLVEQFPIVRRRAVYELIINTIKMRASEYHVEVTFVKQHLIQIMKIDRPAAPTAFQLIWDKYRLSELLPIDDNVIVELSAKNKDIKGKVNEAVEKLMKQTMAIADTIASQASTTLLVSTCKEFGVTVEDVISEINRRRSRKAS